jgi:hypothetical protein
MERPLIGIDKHVGTQRGSTAHNIHRKALARGRAVVSLQGRIAHDQATASTRPRRAARQQLTRTEDRQ